MSQYEYYTSSPYILFAKAEGYFDHIDDFAALFRNLAGVVNRTGGGKADMVSLWPLHNDPKPEIIKIFTADELKEMTANANKKFSKLNKK